jgi:hypothetical protein
MEIKEELICFQILITHNFMNLQNFKIYMFIKANYLL